MKRLFLCMIMILAGTSSMLRPASAEEGPPAPNARRIVLHGVDCTSPATGVCVEARAVFDEALRILREQDGPFTVSIARPKDRSVTAARDVRAASDHY
jgi:hypothetical protein